VTSDRGIDGRTEVSVLLDDVTLLILELNVLSSLVHLSQDLDSLALNLGKSTLLVFGLSETDLFSSLSMFLLSLLFTLDESRLEQVESLILETLDIVFTFTPFSELLFFHELTA